MRLCRRNLHEMAGDNIAARNRTCRACENARKRGEALPPIVSKAKLFRAELQRRYPDGNAFGAVQEIAQELGLNRSTAARYARAINYKRPPILLACHKGHPRKLGSTGRWWCPTCTEESHVRCANLRRQQQLELARPQT